MIILKLKKGDKIVEELTRKVKDIKSGIIFGLGALDEATLKLYNLKKKEFKSKKISGPLEIGSFMAIVAKNPDGKTGIHPHIVVSSADFASFSGHLEEATVSATFEAVIFESDEKLERYEDFQIGLNLLKD